MRQSKTPQREPFFRKALKISLGIHIGIIVVVLMQTTLATFFASSTRDEKEALRKAEMAKQAIRVDMVDLPRYKLDELNKIDLTEDIAEDKVESTESSDVTPSEKAMKLKDEAAAKEAAAKAEVQKKAELEKRAKDKRMAEEKERLAELRARLRADARRQELAGKLQGGRDVLAGNKISKGFSQTGDIATDADEYVGLLRAHVHKNWHVPSWMKASALKAVMLVKLAPDGRVKEKSFVRRSGNSTFDATVESAIERADPFPAPPRSLARMYMEDGFECGFPN